MVLLFAHNSWRAFLSRRGRRGNGKVRPVAVISHFARRPGQATTRKRDGTADTGVPGPHVRDMFDHAGRCAACPCGEQGCFSAAQTGRTRWDDARVPARRAWQVERWLFAPRQLGLIRGLVVLLAANFLSYAMSGGDNESTVGIPSLIDPPLKANLVLMAVFAGCERFILPGQGH